MTYITVIKWSPPFLRHPVSFRYRKPEHHIIRHDSNFSLKLYLNSGQISRQQQSYGMPYSAFFFIKYEITGNELLTVHLFSDIDTLRVNEFSDLSCFKGLWWRGIGEALNGTPWISAIFLLCKKYYSLHWTPKDILL